MSTPRKVAMVAETKDRMERAQVAISADYSGLSVAQLVRLRRALRDSDAEVAVVKNTLAIRAADEAGRPEMRELLSGPTAIAFGYGDPIAPAKALVNHLGEANLSITIHAGWLDGKIMTGDDVRALAKLPSKEQMLADVIGKLKTPLYNLSGLLTTTQRNFHGLVEARAQQLEDQGAA